jgi:hypothetical protein
VSYPVLSGAVVITAANRRLRFREAAGAVGNVDLATGTYYLRGAYATNLITQSENLASTWTLSANCSATANAAISPNGGSAYLLTQTDAISVGNGSIGVTFTGNGSKVVSVFVKRPSSGAASITDFNLFDQTALVNRYIVRITWATDGTPTLSTVGGSGTLFAPTNVGNGWWRIAFTADNIVAANANFLYIYPTGTALPATGAVLIWGVQAEDATTPGPYVATTGTSATGPSNELALAIRDSLTAFGVGGNTYDVSLSADIDPGKQASTLTITRASGSDTFGLVKDGSQTFDYDLLGFSASTANDSASKSGVRSAAAVWVGNDVLREREPSGERMVSVPRRANGGVVGVSRSAHMVSWSLGFAFVHEARMLLRSSVDPGGSLESFVRRFGAGAAFQAREVDVASGSVLAPIIEHPFATLHWSEDTLSSFSPRRIGPGVPLYDLDTVAHEQVT